MADSLSHRERVVALLAVLSSGAWRRAAGPDRGPENVAFALCRLWMDELYVPGLHYVAGLKGDRAEADVQAFTACFSDEEQAALARFHRFMELRLQMLPPAARREERFPLNEAWDALARHAGYVLEELAPDPALVRRLQDALDAGRLLG